LANLLIDLLTPRHTAANQQRVARYSPRYRLAFSLLNENAALGKSAIGWDPNDALSREPKPALQKTPHLPDPPGYLIPTLQSLQLLHNFTIESQVQFHAPLAFDPTHITHSDDSAHGLTHEDLTVFVNSAEWSLCTHFILYMEYLNAN